MLERQVEVGPASPLRARATLWRQWLFESALPVWAKNGVTPEGGFFDRLALDATPVLLPLRLRVQARQTFVFAEAGRLGWAGDWRTPLIGGLRFLLDRAQLSDGLVAHLFSLDGHVTDARPDFYDQSFALLAFAGAFARLGDERARRAAYALLDGLEQYRAPRGGFKEMRSEADAVLMANPHMHLLEACLAWSAIDDDPRWATLCDELSELCANRLVTHLGALRELFDDNWEILPTAAGDETEPGHYYEWAWLLLRHGDHRELATRLAERAEGVGVDIRRNVVVNTVDVHGRLLNAGARLWPQTERLKAALALRAVDERWTERAVQAVDSWRHFTDPVLPGLWLDRMRADGSLHHEPVLASSFYHLVGGIAHLLDTVAP